MASTYSNLKIELIGTGEQAGTWGTTTNTNLGTTIEQAIVGKADITLTSTSETISLTNSNALQDARALYLNLSGTPGGATTLNVPAIEKNYIVKNGSDQIVTIKVSGQTGVAIPVGKTVLVYNNSTDVVTAVDHIPSLTLGAALPVASGGTGTTSTTFVNLATNVTGTLPIANGGTGATTYTDGVILKASSGVFAGATAGSDYAKPSVTSTWSISQRGTVTTDNDLSFDMDVTNNFLATPTGNATLTFTHITAGQSGNIWLDNSGGHTISADGAVYISANTLTAISAAGIYWLSYYSPDGTNVAVAATGSLT